MDKLVFTSTPQWKEQDLPDPSDYRTFTPFIKGVFSQWHQTAFDLWGLSFTCAEQSMMYGKAVLFGDQTRAQAILETDDPALQKRLGSQVEPFDLDKWIEWRTDIVAQGTLAKFSQNDGARRRLLNTEGTMLVEANPRDWNWGNGLQLDDPANHDPAKWKGANLLGRILTSVREKLAS